MRYLTSLVLLCCLSTAYALPINSYFQQGLTIDNLSSKTIKITDTTDLAALNDKPLLSGYELKGTYGADRFTNPAGQTFSHIINIVGDKFICTVVSHLTITVNSFQSARPTSSDAAKCDTSTYLSSGSKGTVYGFKIIVRD